MRSVLKEMNDSVCGGGGGGGGGGFFLACEDFGRMFHNSFLVCAFFLSFFLSLSIYLFLSGD